MQYPNYSQPPYYSAMPVAASRNYGGFWIRVGAYLLDAVLLVIVQLILSRLIDNELQVNLIYICIGWLYFAGFESQIGGTPGKQVLGLTVTDLDGNTISFPRATGRYFAKIVSALILLIGFIMIAFSETKQGLHDKIAGTLVLKS